MHVSFTIENLEILWTWNVEYLIPPTPPTNCLKDFISFNSPTNCTSYICAESYETAVALDNAAVQVALAAAVSGR
jgi:hypothetical protein